MKIIFFVLLIYSITVQSNESANQNVSRGLISEYYIEGRFLIRDCFKKHYVCVSEKNYNSCENLRKSRLNRQLSNLGCLPVKSFKSINSCKKEQLLRISGNKKVHRCKHPKTFN